MVVVKPLRRLEIYAGKIGGSASLLVNLCLAL